MQCIGLALILQRACTDFTHGQCSGGRVCRCDPSEGGQVLVVKKMCHLLTLVGVPDNVSGPLKVAKKL